ncbi:MAG: hypothetical protein KGI83_02535 [Verrucomicrobiota bacterium]|nr:hypothetical protein [Verrucomicrobiota bacterium]
MTDPVCYARETWVKAQLVEEGDSKISCLARKIFFYLSAVFFALVALLTTLPGVALRGAASYLQETPYCTEVVGSGKQLPSDGAFTLLSWNICCIGAGYSITDGDVVPWQEDRLNKIADKIIEKNADVNCLYEVFDWKAACQLKEKLKGAGYTHFYYNIGARGIGASSGIMVASKYAMDQPAFTPFPQETLVGRTQYCSKGVLSFDLQSRGRSFARLFATHLQHSELPESPTPDEVQGRVRQMQLIVDQVDQVRDRCVILTGDLNLDDAEYAASAWHALFERGNQIEKTWRGDRFCANLVGKPESKALNLDYTLARLGTAQTIHHSIVETGYDPAVYRPEALSDHLGILTEVQLIQNER